MSFFFTRLGVALGVFGDFLPLVGDFVFAGCGLSVVIGELSPILSQSLAWFEGETRRMADVRSSELKTGLSSSGGPEGGDTAVSAPRVVRAFHALEEVCGLDEETVSRFKDRFQFSEPVRVRRPTSEYRASHFFPGEVCFYEAAFTYGLRLPVHPFIMELLGFLGIALGQLMPNSWRIVVNCMEIWLAANEDMIKVSELVHLYRLKESKEYGYYELVPWARRARIVRGLPSSFRYWKFRFVFVSGDDFETPASEAWGDVLRLLRQWGTPHLGASILPIVCWFMFFLSLLVVNNLPLFPCAVKRRPKLKSKY